MNNTVYPCLWFDNNASDVVQYYLSIFNDSQILYQNQFMIQFKIYGTKFMAINGGPKYKVNPSVSYFIYCGGSLEEIDRLYSRLSDGGKIIIPIGQQPWSERYAWVEDKYGVNWQFDIDAINNPQKIVPSLLFANEKMLLLREAREHYISIFKESKALFEVKAETERNFPFGTLDFVQFRLNDMIVNVLMSNLKHDFDFTEANSFVIECNDQEEIDHYWNALTKEGEESMCGWLKDKYRLSWQVIPNILTSLIEDTKRAPKVFAEMQKMRKFEINTLLSA